MHFLIFCPSASLKYRVTEAVDLYFNRPNKNTPLVLEVKHESLATPHGRVGSTNCVHTLKTPLAPEYRLNAKGAHMIGDRVSLNVVQAGLELRNPPAYA